MKHAFVSPLCATVHFIKDHIQEGKSKILYQKKPLILLLFLFLTIHFEMPHRMTVLQ